MLARLHTPAFPLERLGPDEARRFLAQMTFYPEPLPAQTDELVDALGGVILALALLGCSSPAELTEAHVQALPAGDADGGYPVAS